MLVEIGFQTAKSPATFETELLRSLPSFFPGNTAKIDFVKRRYQRSAVSTEVTVKVDRMELLIPQHAQDLIDVAFCGLHRRSTNRRRHGNHLVPSSVLSFSFGKKGEEPQVQDEFDILRP